MEDRTLLAGAVMLETMWETHRSDLLDLITPFVFYAVSKQASPNDRIDIRRVLNYVQEELGYPDMVIHVVEKVLSRHPEIIRKEKGEYYLRKRLDNENNEIEKRKAECDDKIDKLGEQIADYLNNHIIDGKKFDSKRAICSLNGFFSRYGIYVGVDRLDEQYEDLKKNKEDYYIAQYIFEKREEKAKEYDFINDLVKGFFLKSAIYLQGTNGSIKSASYKDVSFYYDTPYLLALLGYKSDDEEQSAKELHDSLVRQKGHFYYFPQTQQEILSILTAYQYSIGKASPVTLEGLDKRNYTFEGISRLKSTWEARLSSEFSVKGSERPSYALGADGKIDQRYVIDEEKLIEEIKKHVRWRSEKSMNADFESALAIHRIRKDVSTNEIERCKSVFVTTYKRFVKYFNTYYRDNVNKDTFPLLITDIDLAALTWIKCGAVSNLPERELLRNAYMAMQPTSDMMEKFSDILNQMESEGTITGAEVAAIRISPYTKKEILFSTFEQNGNVTVTTVQRVRKKIEEEVIRPAREDEKAKAEKRREENEHKRLVKAEGQAKEYSKQCGQKALKWMRYAKKAIGWALIGFAIWGTIESWNGLKIWPISFIAFACVTFSSIVQTVFGPGKWIDEWLVKLSNIVSDKKYREKLEEYNRIIDTVTNRK